MGILTRWFNPNLNAEIQRQTDIKLAELMPGLQQKITANLYNQNVFQWLNAGQIIVDYENKYNFVIDGFQSNADVYTCIDLISKKVSECSYTVFEIKQGVTKKELKAYENYQQSDSLSGKLKAMQLKEQLFIEVDNCPIHELLEQPNPMQNYEDWITDLAGFYLCTGDGYIFGNGVSPEMIEKQIWSELYCLPSHYMKIVTGGYLKPILGYELISVFSTDVPFPANQVNHFKTFNPDFTMTGASLYGQSPIRAVFKNVIKENQGEDELLKQIRNGGVMGFISPDGSDAKLTNDQLGLLKSKIEDAKAGEGLMDRIFPSTGPLKWTQIGMPSTDLQLIQSLAIDTKKIFSAFHVPMIYSGSEEASNMSNVSSAPKQFIYNAVSPLLRKLKASINEFVCKPYAKTYGIKYYFDYDIASYPEMSEDMTKLSDWLEASWEITPNEKRVAKGYDRSMDPLLDEYYAPSSIVPLKDLSLDSAYNQPFNGAGANKVS